MARRHGGAAADLPPLHPPSKRPWSPSTWRFAMEEEEEEEEQEEELPGLHLPLPAPAPPLAKARLAPLPPPPQWRSKSGRAADLRAANGGGGSHGFYDCSFSNYYPYSNHNHNHNHSYYSYYSSSTHTNASYSSYSRNGGFVWDAGEDGGGITMLLQRRRWRRGWNAEDYGGEGAVAMWKSEAGTGILQVKAKEAVSRKARQEEMAEDVESKDMNRSRSRRRRERRSESEPEPEEDRDGTAANAEAGVMEKQQQQEEVGEGDIGKWRRRQKLQKVQNQKVQKKQKKLKKKQKKKAGEQREMSPSERYYCEICRNSMVASASALLPLGHHHHHHHNL